MRMSYMTTDIKLLVSWKVEFKVLHVFRSLIQEKPSSKLCWCVPEGIAWFTVQLELCMHPIHTMQRTHNICHKLRKKKGLLQPVN